MNNHCFLPIMETSMNMQENYMARNSKCSMFPNGLNSTTTTKTRQYLSKTFPGLLSLFPIGTNRNPKEEKVSKALYVKVTSIERHTLVSKTFHLLVPPGNCITGNVRLV